MKKLIRNSVFETNSSSTHSISIASKENGLKYDTIVPNSSGVITVPLIEFGWEQDTYYNPIEKLSYMWIYVRDWCDKVKEEFEAILKKVVCEHTGASDIVPEEPKYIFGYLENGYIDHQSVESNNYHYLFENEGELLKDFIFATDSYLETDNDNH